MNTTPTDTSSLPVAQVIETLGMGGAENLAVQIANALAGRGFASHLIVMTEPGPLSERVDPAVKLHYLGFWRASIRNPFAFLSSMRRGMQALSALIEAEGIDLVQTHLPGANFWGLFLALRSRCRVVATIHNNQEFRYGEVDNWLLLRLRKRAYREIVLRCTGTVAVSEKVKVSLLADLGLPATAGDRVTVVTNGVTIPEALTADEKEEIRTRFGVTAATTLILAAGRFGEQKNFADLVRAAGILKNRGLDFKLVLAGEGEQAEMLKAQVGESGLADHVFLPGNLSDLRQVMQAADVYAMSSLWEGLPLVLLEAMGAGLPAVAYGIPGVAELLQDQVTGFQAVPGDPESLAEGLAALVASPEKRLAMGRAGRALVAEQFNFEDVVLRLCKLYGGQSGASFLVTP